MWAEASTGIHETRAWKILQNKVALVESYSFSTSLMFDGVKDVTPPRLELLNGLEEMYQDEGWAAGEKAMVGHICEALCVGMENQNQNQNLRLQLATHEMGENDRPFLFFTVGALLWLPVVILCQISRFLFQYWTVFRIILSWYPLGTPYPHCYPKILPLLRHNWFWKHIKD